MAILTAPLPLHSACHIAGLKCGDAGGKIVPSLTNPGSIPGAATTSADLAEASACGKIR